MSLIAPLWPTPSITRHPIPPTCNVACILNAWLVDARIRISSMYLELCICIWLRVFSVRFCITKFIHSFRFLTHYHWLAMVSWLCVGVLGVSARYSYSFSYRLLILLFVYVYTSYNIFLKIVFISRTFAELFSNSSNVMVPLIYRLKNALNAKIMKFAHSLLRSRFILQLGSVCPLSNR